MDGLPTLRVIDNGPGIAPDERVRVFDRFYRAPQAAALSEVGSGLGLAIVKAIADRHRARVSLHAGRDGAGLEVRVSFAAPLPVQSPGASQRSAVRVDATDVSICHSAVAPDS